jgi:hypothetical protein
VRNKEKRESGNPYYCYSTQMTYTHSCSAKKAEEQKTFCQPIRDFETPTRRGARMTCPGTPQDAEVLA